MDAAHSTVSNQQHNHTERWDPRQIAELMREYEGNDELSQRQFALQAQVPRTTLQGWIHRRENIDLPNEWVAFLESPQGVAFLHRMMTALHLVFGHLAAGSPRKISQFLNLTGLDQVVAPSPSSQQQYSQAVSEQIAAYGVHQQAELGEGMPTKNIAVCEDETFHPKICLVAIEPTSGFILLEKYVDHRDAQTWEENLQQATAGLPLKIVQIVSDEAKGLIAHAQKHDAHHSPDVFHVQLELSKATSASLAGQTRRAEQAHEQASQEADQQASLAAACEDQCPDSSIRPALDTVAAEAARQAEQAKQKAAACRERQQQAQQARRGISDAYHPFDLESGAGQDAEHVQERLERHFDELERVASEAGLSSGCRERIAKARRLVVKMAATIAFFWRLVHQQLEGLSLTPELERSLLEEWLPAKYLALAAGKATTAERRQALHEAAERLDALARDGPWKDLPEAEQLGLEQQAASWAGLFQRSSSCVEGRNGQLSLWHHSVHRLSPLRLCALTVLHNYFLCRPDGTTAAERFFGRSPSSLMEWLLEHVPLPSRPAPRRQTA